MRIETHRLKTIHLRACVALLLLLVLAGLAHADASPVEAVPVEAAKGPSFSCAKAIAPVDRAVCADPALSDLDLRLETTFRSALRRDGADRAALLDDQRHWLVARAPVCQFSASGDAPDDSVACLADLYQTRIALLESQGGAATDPLCQDIADAIRAGGGFIADTGWTPLVSGLTADPHGPARFSVSGEGLTKARRARFPGLGGTETDLDSSELHKFGARDMLRAVESIGGTAQCKSMAFFTQTGDRLSAIEGPPAAGDGGACWTSSIFVGDAATTPLFAEEDFAIARSSLDLWTRRGGTWSPACVITAAYDTRIETSARFYPAATPPAAMEALALRIARARAAAEPITPSVKPTVTLAGFTRAERRDFDGVDDGLALFGRDTPDGYTTFETGAPLYAGETPNGPAVVQISHGTMGWRTDDGYLVTIYNRNGEKLTPAASFILDKLRVSLKSVTVAPLKRPGTPEAAH